MPNGTSQPPVTRRYYPTLSSVMSQDDIPEILGFVKDGILWLFDKIHYKDLQYSKSPRGDAAFYSLSVVASERLDIELPGTGIYLVLNPDITGGDSHISSFPITVEYEWKILAYLRAFNLGNFSYDPQAFFEMALRILNISEEQAMAQFINQFVVPVNNTTTPLQQFVTDINDYLGSTIPLPTDETKLSDVVQQIYTQSGNQYSSVVAFGKYLVSNNVNDTLTNVKVYYNAFIPQNIDDYIKDIVVPKFRATLTLIAGIEFPRNMLVPVYPEDTIISGEDVSYEPMPEPAKAMFTFAEALFYADSRQGFGYNMDLVINTVKPVAIGNTGIVVNIHNLKIDLSTTSNFPEADADGRPLEFMGIYTEQTDIILPPRWFSKDTEATQTLKIAGKHLLVGRGGISGTIALEAINTGNPPGETDFFWVKLGKDDEKAWKLGFNSFDITFSQGDIVSSNIRAQLIIPTFKKSNGEVAEINVVGSFESDGDFKLTASTTPPYPTIDFGDIFRFHMKSVELGREDGDFFIGASCDVEFLGMMGSFLEGQSISISSLRIYSNGRIEFKVDGGNLTLPKPIKLNLGPVQVSVTAIHFGSTERQKDGIMRKYNYFGFDGGVNVGVAGLDARGDGIKFYYTVDDGPGKPHDSYLHIQTIHIDLVIPANSSDPNVILNGWLSIPEPGVSPEYRGGVSLKLKNPRISGKVDMRLAPKYPAFLIDAGIELPNPIALGPVSIYGFKGLLGYRYVAEKEAIGMTSENTWYQYYKAPVRGVNVDKFSGPEKTEDYSNPISLGVGAILGDTMAMGNILSANAMLLLSLPSMIMVDARMKLLSKRVSFSDDPPFFAFFIIGDNSMEFGFGADYKFPETSGDIIKVYAEIQAGFFFDNPSAWYINIGTDQMPISASLLRNLFTLKAYVMLSGKGIRAGARGEFRFERSIGPVGLKFLAYMELGGRISFERPQMGGYFEMGVEVSLKLVIVNFSLAISVLLAVESPKPFMVYGKFDVRIKLKILFVINIKVSGTVELKWEFNKNVDRTPINPLTETPAQIEGLVKGISMLTGETFGLANLRKANGTIDVNLTEIRKKVIPLDTYIDIKTTKGLLPSNQISNIIGGLNNPPEQYKDLIPPERVMKGVEVRQVKHQYSIEDIKIMAHSPTAGWRPYNPYRAMYPNNTEPQLNVMKAGQWQKKDDQYNAIRILATSPFSYTEQGEPGWFIPEQYGITPKTLFCEGIKKNPHISHFLNKNLGAIYFASNNSFFSSMQANYQIQGITEYYNDSEGNIIPEGEFGRITDRFNVFGYKQSLEFPQGVPLVIMLSDTSVEIQLKMTCSRQSMVVECYQPLINDQSSIVQYELVVTKIFTSSELAEKVKILLPVSQAVTKLVLHSQGEGKEMDMLHEIQWITLEEYQYNLNIPNQQSINADTAATMSAVNDYLPPIWRPDTSYYVQFTLKDEIDNGESQATFNFAYGFHTAGPVGFFHTDKYSPYGHLDYKDVDQYAHTSMRSYIDYKRSYPNADGDLVSAKPMFYNDTTTEVNLYFTSRYAERLLNGWEAYENFPALGGTMKIIIKDPVEDVEIVNPPNLETTYESIELSSLPIPQTIEQWVLDSSPLLTTTVNQWFGMLPGGCTVVQGEPKPLTYYRKIETKRLKPQKLYTVQLLNFYWGTNDDIDPEVIESDVKDKYARSVHQYVFQTSRYRNFEHQIQSYYNYNEEGTILLSQNSYRIEVELDTNKIQAALDTILGEPNSLSQSIETQFQHPFDRIVEGLFGIPTLNKSIATEINSIVNSVTGKVIGLLIRSPEPFNNPRFALEVVNRSEVQNGMVEVFKPDLSEIDLNFEILYSKDYSQAIIMHLSKVINTQTVHIQFHYKIWNGTEYPVVDTQKLINVPIV